jgi:hypothetical protein
MLNVLKGNLLSPLNQELKGRDFTHTLNVVQNTGWHPLSGYLYVALAEVAPVGKDCRYLSYTMTTGF